MLALYAAPSAAHRRPLGVRPRQHPRAHRVLLRGEPAQGGQGRELVPRADCVRGAHARGLDGGRAQVERVPRIDRARERRQVARLGAHRDRARVRRVHAPREREEPAPGQCRGRRSRPLHRAHRHLAPRNPRTDEDDGLVRLGVAQDPGGLPRIVQGQGGRGARTHPRQPMVGCGAPQIQHEPSGQQPRRMVGAHAPVELQPMRVCRSRVERPEKMRRRRRAVDVVFGDHGGARTERRGPGGVALERAAEEILPTQMGWDGRGEPESVDYPRSHHGRAPSVRGGERGNGRSQHAGRLDAIRGRGRLDARDKRGSSRQRRASGSGFARTWQSTSTPRGKARANTRSCSTAGAPSAATEAGGSRAPVTGAPRDYTVWIKGRFRFYDNEPFSQKPWTELEPRHSRVRFELRDGANAAQIRIYPQFDARHGEGPGNGRHRVRETVADEIHHLRKQQQSSQQGRRLATGHSAHPRVARRPGVERPRPARRHAHHQRQGGRDDAREDRARLSPCTDSPLPKARKHRAFAHRGVPGGG